jgi:hypothetical protein
MNAKIIGVPPLRTMDDVHRLGEEVVRRGYRALKTNIVYPGDENFGLWVDRSTKAISYAPWARCPGPHLQIIEQLKKRFGGGG